MSHHLDYIEDARLDISDVYCFRGTSGTVFVMDLSPLAPSGFQHEAVYELKVDTDGDAVENLTWRVTMPFVGGTQRLRIERLTGSAARDRDATGVVITPDGAGLNQIVTCADGTKAFAGERGEPFYNDPRLTLETKRALATGTAPNYATYDPNSAQNAFGDSNVSAIVLEAPASVTGSGTIGFWGTSVLPTDAGGWRQLQHAASPLLSFVFDFSQSGDFQASHPTEQKARFGPQLVRQLAAVLRQTGTYDDATGYGRSTPEAYAEYVRDTLFPDVLRYRVGTAAEWGPRSQNGKGLTESGPEAFYELLLNTHVEMGLDASDATGTLLNRFPYLSEPIGGGTRSSQLVGA
jgi:Domain of unknown function (DUF4331)